MTVAHLVVMGVAGSGKSTVGALISEKLDRPFAEGDEFHSISNVTKMQQGQPLSDEDRADWLISIRDWMSSQAKQNVGVVITCSALRRDYRDTLRGATGKVFFLHLLGSQEDVQRRMAARADHFMPLSLLPSQFSALEPLEIDEPGLTVSVTPPPESIVAECLPSLKKLMAEPQNTTRSSN